MDGKTVTDFRGSALAASPRPRGWGKARSWAVSTLGSASRVQSEPVGLSPALLALCCRHSEAAQEPRLSSPGRGPSPVAGSCFLPHLGDSPRHRMSEETPGLSLGVRTCQTGVAQQKPLAGSLGPCMAGALITSDLSPSRRGREQCSKVTLHSKYSLSKHHLKHTLSSPLRQHRWVFNSEAE